MPPALARWLPRAVVATLVVAAATLAWREGGGADSHKSPPRAEAATADELESKAGRGAIAYEVKTRLVEALADARLEVPNLAAAQPAFDSYWRKLRGPWVRLPGTAGRLANTVSLRTSADSEAQWAVPTQAGETWVPDARVWNMNEGSFDQREAIYAPSPATLTFHLTVPPSARLRFAPALLSTLGATTLFEVTLVDAAGVEHPVWQMRAPPGAAKKWTDVDQDLSAWGGQSVDLRFRTSTKPTGGIALALWGDPVLVAKEPTRVPYDVLWIVVDALRPDVAASLHNATEDAANLAAPHPPLEAVLPAIPGLMPNIDALAARGVHFEHAWSAGAWTRPGTLAMLSGERSSELGIDTLSWVIPADRVGRYYASEPPLVPRVLRKSGVATAAFVNNFFMAGYAAVGLDMGFERVTDHRYRTRDTAAITRDALAWLDGHGQDRFFLFVNFNSPHQPYDPPKEMLGRVPPPCLDHGPAKPQTCPPGPAGPRDPQVRAYMAEGAKDDAAIGLLLEKLAELEVSEHTLVIVTSDHGETLSAAHDAPAPATSEHGRNAGTPAPNPSERSGDSSGDGPDKMSMRFHHAIGDFEETTRVPIVMALPGSSTEAGRYRSA